MYTKRLKDYFQKKVKLRSYNNVVEASYWSRVARRLSGTSVYELHSTSGNCIVSRFNAIGFFFFIFWNLIYVYCTYASYSKDQTILRLLYKTKLKRFGDDYERIASSLYLFVLLIIVPFRVSGNHIMMQKIVVIDTVIERTGDIMDYNKTAKTAFLLALSLVVVYCSRLICIWVSLSSSIVLPVEKMFQVLFSDAYALILTAIFCYYLSIMRFRFQWINRTLTEIKTRNSWEYKVFVRGKIPANMTKVVQLQDKHICDKIKTCARVYSMLYDACHSTSEVFGFALLSTLFHYYAYIVLYLFYFMEATASGLFHDLNTYCDFLVYTFWEIAVALAIIYMIIYHSDSTAKEAKRAAYVCHEIINEDLSTAVNSEALHLSFQLLHESPEFTVCGLFTLNYALLMQGTWAVSTYLVMLLQFVTEQSQSI